MSSLKALHDRRKKLTLEVLKKALKHAKPLKAFKQGTLIKVNDRMQKNYSYRLDAKPGAIEFPAYYNPKEMLIMGVFEGKYCNDCILEFPREWFEAAIKAGSLSPEGADSNLNYWGIKSRMSLQEWIDKGWILDDDPDPRGWFQWYMRYWLGRRSVEDERQIKRWNQIKRHQAQVKKHSKGRLDERPKQRQTLLQWSYDCMI